MRAASETTRARRVLEQPRRISYSLVLYPDEYFQSALTRWAHDLGTTRACLLTWFGLRRLEPTEIRSLGNFIRGDVLQAVSFSTRIPTERLRESTMENLNGRALILNPADAFASTAVNRQSPLARLSGTRYCPVCLRENPGVMLQRWRLNWAFVCPAHRCLLQDVCGHCGQPPREERTRSKGREIDPSLCSHCGHILSDHPSFDVVPVESPIIKSQVEINAIIDFGQQPLADLADTGSVIAALRAAQNLDRIAEIADIETSRLSTLVETEVHPGSSAPADALAMGALATAARVILTSDEEVSRTWIRMTSLERVLTSAPREDQLGPGSAREFLQKYPGSLDSPALRQRILRAHDLDLSLTQRITWGTSVTAATRMRYPTSGIYMPLHGCLPSAFWPRWTARLDTGSRVDIAALQHGLVVATSLVDVHESHDPSNGYAPATSLAKYLRPNMLGSELQATQVIGGIVELALWLKAHGMQIDYRRRGGIPHSLLLQSDHWERICESASADPGRTRRRSLARLYLAQRIRGARRSRRHELPAYGAPESEFTDFKFSLTHELQSSMDDYARALLDLLGIREPLRWEPPLLPVDRGIPGRELHDIDIERLHVMLLDGEHRQGILARELGVTTRHLVAAVDEWPPSVLRVPKTVPWRAADWAA